MTETERDWLSDHVQRSQVQTELIKCGLAGTESEIDEAIWWATGGPEHES